MTEPVTSPPRFTNIRRLTLEQAAGVITHTSEANDLVRPAKRGGVDVVEHQ
ncbi:MAG TPA: hypothetical protein VF657_06890 [Actinoplanes sp.]